MQQDIDEDTLIKNYLLGNLSQEEQLHIEERLFFDREYFQTLQAAEDELIDDYVYGELSTKERERFEEYYLSTRERREALKVAQALKSYISNNPLAMLPPIASAAGPAPPARLSFLSSLRLGSASWQLPLAVATLLIIIGGLSLLLWSARRPEGTEPPQEARQSPQPGTNQSSPLQSNEQMSPNTNLNAEPQNKQEQYAGQRNQESTSGNSRTKESDPLSPGKRDKQAYSSNAQSKQRATRTYAFLLAPVGITRGDGRFNEVPVPADARIISLQLPLVEDIDYRNFRAGLYGEDDDVIRSWNDLHLTDSKTAKVVSVSVPAQLLQQQNYSIKLIGILPDGGVKEIQTYHFRVIRR